MEPELSWAVIKYARPDTARDVAGTYLLPPLPRPYIGLIKFDSLGPLLEGKMTLSPIIQFTTPDTTSVGDTLITFKDILVSHSFELTILPWPYLITSRVLKLFAPLLALVGPAPASHQGQADACAFEGRVLKLSCLRNFLPQVFRCCRT
jgi:hypothetical protein